MPEKNDDRPFQPLPGPDDVIVRSSSFPELDPYPVIELDLEGNLQYVNPATETLLPDIEEEGINHPFFSDWHRIVRDLRENRNGPIVREVRVGDNWFHQQFYFIPELNRVRTYAVEISEIKRAYDALRESEAKYRSLFEYTPGVVTLRQLLFDENGEIIDQVLIDANPKFLDTWGVGSVEEVKGKRYSEFLGTKSADLALDGARRMRASGKPVTIEIHYDHVDRDYQMTFVPVGKDQIIAASIDITERKRIELDLRRSNAELQQFANVASHDLQEPLRMVIGYLSLLQKQYDDKLDDEAKEYIDVAVNGGKRMKMLIDDLLAYSRVDVQDKDFAPVDMNQVVKRVLEVLREAVEENKAEIELDPLPTVIAEESQMAQVIQNLVSNAIKFRGKESPRIRITATAGSGEWIFSVSDNGIGLSMEYADRIFQMFQRLHTRDEYPGTGVGLAIVKKIVERHGGRICVESEVGKGATFIFTIPVRSERGNAQSHSASQNR